MKNVIEIEDTIENAFNEYSIEYPHLFIEHRREISFLYRFKTHALKWDLTNEEEVLKRGLEIEAFVNAVKDDVFAINHNLTPGKKTLILFSNQTIEAGPA